MPRRRRHGVIALLALVGAVAGCQADDLGTAGCQIASQKTLAGSPLTLLPHARLDAVGAGYVLIGADAQAVRWASIDVTGAIGTEHAFGLPKGVTSPLFAMAGTTTNSRGDTVLVGWLAPDATQKRGELWMIALPADGSPPMDQASIIHEFTAGLPDPQSVVMVSSRKGLNAGVAWVEASSQQVMLTVVDATGTPVGTPTPTAPVTQPFDCLQFQSGKDDLTLVYEGQFTTSSAMGWVVAEANEGGGIDSYTTVPYNGTPTACAAVAPTSTGYALAWQDAAGGWLRTYVPGSTTRSDAVPFAPSSEFGGADLQPPIVALASFQPDFGVLFQKLRDAELWRIDPMGNRKSGALIFPSAQGNMGSVSTALVPGGMGTLTLTYADYTGSAAVGDGGVSPDGGTTQTGNRLFINAACH
jgi:hypothetical protein